MKMIRKTKFFSLLVIATLFIQNASATMLPISSYEDGYWQGSRFFYEEITEVSFLSGRMDFAVYDTLAYPNEFIGDDGYTAPGDGRYIYAYQIFNDQPLSDEAVAYFSVFQLDENPMDVDVNSIDSEEDTPDSGVEATREYFTGSNVRAVWLFAGQVLMHDEHSWFLVFSSDSPPVPGDYDISAEGGDHVPAPIPEPATLILLGLGSAMVLIVRRRKFI